MTFEEWICDRKIEQGWTNIPLAQDAWDHQQKRIDKLELLLITNWAGYTDELFELLGGKYSKEFLATGEEV